MILILILILTIQDSIMLNECFSWLFLIHNDASPFSPGMLPLIVHSRISLKHIRCSIYICSGLVYLNAYAPHWLAELIYVQKEGVYLKFEQENSHGLSTYSLNFRSIDANQQIWLAVFSNSFFNIYKSAACLN